MDDFEKFVEIIDYVKAKGKSLELDRLCGYTKGETPFHVLRVFFHDIPDIQKMMVALSELNRHATFMIGISGACLTIYGCHEDSRYQDEWNWWVDQSNRMEK